jgi:hypothetical protein
MLTFQFLHVCEYLSAAFVQLKRKARYKIFVSHFLSELLYHVPIVFSAETWHSSLGGFSDSSSWLDFVFRKEKRGMHFLNFSGVRSIYSVLLLVNPWVLYNITWYFVQLWNKAIIFLFLHPLALTGDLGFAWASLHETEFLLSVWLFQSFFFFFYSWRLTA